MTRRSCWRSSPEKRLVSTAARALESGVYFAPALIATKPVKPCDGGVFGALNLLLISERQAAGQAGFAPGPANPEPGTKPNSNPARSQPQPNWLLAACLSDLSAICLRFVCAMNRALPAPQLWRGCRKLRFQHPFRAGPRAGSHPRPPPATIADFAPALIATKPVKPCDGGVFGALNLLLISERQATNQAAFRPA